MFISNSKRFIYIHLHKCAGTSIEQALAASLQWNDILLGSTQLGEQLQGIYKQLFRLHKHSNAHEIKDVVGPEIWQQYFKFSSVRNPYSLAVSQFTYSLQQLKFAERRRASLLPIEGTFTYQKPQNRWPYDYPGVRALIEAGGLQAEFGRFIRSSHLQNWRGFSNQADQLSIDGKLTPNATIKVEQLPDQWVDICQTIGLGHLTLPLANQSAIGSSKYQDYYRSTNDIDYIYSAFEKDFDTFSYPKLLTR